METCDLITSFYTAFANADAEGMIACYSDDVIFSDPAFGTLEGDRAKAMWRMLMSRGSGLKVTFDNVEGNDEGGSATWVANYTYGPKKRPVTNNVSATFDVIDGLIVRHQDTFDLWQWSKQALGVPGLLLGWSSFMRNKIQATTNGLLDAYLLKTS